MTTPSSRPRSSRSSDWAPPRYRLETGFGTHGEKHATWGRLQESASPELWWGWKNFHDEDQPMMTPAETAAIRPAVYFVSYQ